MSVPNIQTKNVNLTVAQEEKSGDHQSHYLGTLENYKKNSW